MPNIESNIKQPKSFFKKRMEFLLWENATQALENTQPGYPALVVGFGMVEYHVQLSATSKVKRFSSTFVTHEIHPDLSFGDIHLNGYLHDLLFTEYKLRKLEGMIYVSQKEADIS